MKKIIPFLFIVIILAGGLGYIVTSEPSDHKTKIERIVFSEPTIEEQEYSILKMKESNSYLMEDHKPMLPRYTKTFTFPFNTDIKEVKCIAENIQRIKISTQLLPTPEKISLGTFSKTRGEESIYTLTEPYPERWYDYNIGCGIVGDERKIIVKIDILPIKYHPSESCISWAKEVEIEIQIETKIESLTYDNEYDLLILTPNKYSSQIQPLVDHKNGRGISTTVVTLSEISDETYFTTQGRDEIEKIKYFIKNAIENWNVTNVLIVGGANDFPARKTHVQLEDDDEIFVSDLYYADIYDEKRNFSSWDTNENNIFAEYKWDGETDEIDFYPDVKIGRLACINNEQVTTTVNKIIKYEKDKAYTQNWFYNIVVIGGDTIPESYGDDSDTDEGELVNQFILDRMQGFIPDKIWDSNGRLSGLITTGLTNIKKGIENGCGFLDFSGHGAPFVWTTFPHNGDYQTLPTPTGSYTNTIINQLTNEDMLPIVINGGCSLGKYQDDENCNAWAFLSNPNGGGIASFGATGLGYVYIGKHVTEGLVEGLNIDIIEAYRDGATTFGEMYAEGLNTYIHSNLDDGDYKTLMEWHAFGDPTLQIGEVSNPPEKPSTPDGPVSGKKGESYNYISSSIDSDGDDLYYLFDWGDETYSGWIGPFKNGEEATAGKTWEKQGNYEIRVRARDEHGAQSEWSDPLVASMLKNKATNLNSLFLRAFQNHPKMFSILKMIFGL